MGTIRSINISDAKGTVKHPVNAAELVAGHGIRGDAHAGPWHRQVSLLAQESVDKMTVLGVEDLGPGIFAENLTTEGLVLHTIPVGTLLCVGSCVLRVTQIGKECHQHCEVYQRVGKCVMPTEGIFAEVLTGGLIHPGDSIVCKEG